jgi:predicted nucleotidyltransferase
VLHSYIISTNNQKVLSLLVKYSDRSFYEREISRRLGISSGSANRALNELFSSGVITRRREGKMFFYSISPADATIIALKKIINILLIELLLEKLKKLSNRIVLYGSCALGSDISESDIDLFVVSNRKKEVSNIISNFRFPKGYENLHIQSVIKTPIELLKGGESDHAFMEEVERGVVLWEKVANEPRV